MGEQERGRERGKEGYRRGVRCDGRERKGGGRRGIRGGGEGEEGRGENYHCCNLSLHAVISAIYG